MKTLINGLIQLGWIDDDKLPEYPEDTPKPYWDWLMQCDSDYLVFNAEDAYSAHWDDNQRQSKKAAILKKLQSGKLDLIIAMGTWAGQDLANDQHAVPTLVLSTSDAIGAGIVKSAQKSGLPHVTARVDPNRYIRQIRMFHRIVGFERLGVAYEDSPDGHIWSATKEVQKVAGERGFEPVLCKVLDTNADTEASNSSCLDCYRELAESTDAIYVTALTCVDRQIDSIVEIINDSKTPSFSLVGSKLVKNGILLSISSDSGYAALGSYNGMKFGEMLNGTTPEKLDQLFEDPLDIAVNTKTARSIDFTIPPSILKVAKEIYHK